jgi:DNA primase
VYDVLSIRRSNPIDVVLSEAGVELQSRGRRLVGRCPLHGDGQPSLVVYPDNQSYFCFGCGAGGDVIDFVSRLREVGFKEAASMLAGSGRQPVVQPRSPAGPVQRTAPVNLTHREADVIEAAVRCFHDALWRSTEALAYLRSRRISPSAARHCRLGFGDQGLADCLRKRGLSLAVARSIGLLHGDRCAMLGRIVIPDLHGGRATWLTGRSIDGRDPRYLNPRLAAPLLGLDRVRANELLVTEGPFDWLTAVEWDLPAVALVGSRVSRATVRALSGFRRVFVALDSDDAGRRAAAHLAADLGPRARLVELPAGVKDLNDLASRKDGQVVFRRCLATAASAKEESWDTYGTVPALRAA